MNNVLQETYWIVIAGLPGVGKTTFLRQAADSVTIRDRDDMSIITAEDEKQVLQWLERNGSVLDPYRAFPSPEEERFNRWARRVTIGEIIIDPDLRVCLYEAPSTRDFAFLWAVMTPETYLGSVIMIDSTAHQTVRDASRIGAAFATYADAPYIFVSNKQDLSGGMLPEAVSEILLQSDGHDVPVVPCVAEDGWSSKRALIRLLEMIRETYDDGIQW